MSRHVHADGSATFDDSMMPLKAASAAFPDPSHEDPDPKPVPQRDPGDEDPE